MTKIQIVILWGLAALVVIVFVVLGRVISRPPSGEGAAATLLPPAYTVAEVSQSARGLYAYADQAARSWQEDAAFVSVSTTWNALRVDDLSEPGDWTYQFYSPSSQKLYVVNVRESEVTPIREALAPYPLSAASIDDWRVDSPRALNAWLNYGGGEFVRAHPVVDLSVRLRPSEGGQLEWILAGVVPNSQTVHLVRVDARSGGVLQ